MTVNNNYFILSRTEYVRAVSLALKEKKKKKKEYNGKKSVSLTASF